MSIVTGILFHAGGASCASVCYTPQKSAGRWSWQTYWLAQAAVCWLVLPVAVAAITIPHLKEVLMEAPATAMYTSFILGAAYGIGGTAFGLAIRSVGFSLTYAISVGISCVLGTLLPPLVHGELASVFGNAGAGWLISGIALGAAGIAVCGWAGRLKEKDLAGNGDETGFSLAKGLPLCILAGLLSAVYGFALDQGQPIADIAAKYGGGHFQGNVIYIFANAGAFLSTAIYCIYLHVKQQTFGEYIRFKGAVGKPLRLQLNYLLAFITGMLWYAQFFFYGLGHTRMGVYKFSSWAVHMIMLVLFSALVGLVLKEWLSVKSRTKWILTLALVILILAVVIITYGNYIGSETAIV